jgi:hypothetical protein
MYHSNFGEIPEHNGSDGRNYADKKLSSLKKMFKTSPIVLEKMLKNIPICHKLN